MKSGSFSSTYLRFWSPPSNDWFGVTASGKTDIIINGTSIVTRFTADRRGALMAEGMGAVEYDFRHTLGGHLRFGPIDNPFIAGEVTAPDAQGSTRTTLTCERADGTTYTEVKETAGFFVATDGCSEDGATVTDVQWEAVTDGPDGTENAQQMGAAKVDKQTLRERYADCDLRQRYEGGCQLSVEVAGKKCAYGVAGCEKWQAIADKDAEKVQCKWGAYDMPASDCKALANAYKQQAGKALALDTKQAASQPPAMLDENGQPAPTPPPAPGQDYSGILGSIREGIDSLIGGYTSIGTMIGQGFNDVRASFGDANDQMRKAFKGDSLGEQLGGSFMPDTDTFGQAGDALGEGLGGPGLDGWKSAMNGLTGLHMTSAACMGPAVNLGEPFNATIYPAQACSGPSKMMADLSKIALAAALAWSTVSTCTTWLFSSLGFSARVGDRYVSSGNAPDMGAFYEMLTKTGQKLS